MKRLLFLLLLSFATLRAQLPELQLDLGNGVTMDMILVQPGSFEQGSPVGETRREADEGPQRRVRITQPYYMAKYPVTVAQFERFVQAAKYRTEAEKGESGGFGVVNGKLVQQKQFTWRNPGFEQAEGHPVGMVSAMDAAAFCKWAGKQVQRDCALPTEAQWEYACRAGSTLAHYAEPVDAAAWHRGNSAGVTNAVGQKKPNAWGFHDMYGPVWQWCRDWYAPYPAGAATDPIQTNQKLSDKPRQVLRGGSFISDVSHARSAERYRNDARSRNADNGFRIVCGVEQLQPQVNVATSIGLEEAERRKREMFPTEYGERSSGDGASGGGWLVLVILFGVLGVFALVGFVIVRAVYRAIRGGSRPPPLPGGDLTGSQAADMLAARPEFSGSAHRFAFNLTDDGFFITGSPGATGKRLHYECMVGERAIADDIVFTPGPEGHFIFTGKRPSSVSVQTRGGAAGTESDMTYGSDSSSDDVHRSNFSTSSTSSRFPSAY